MLLARKDGRGQGRLPHGSEAAGLFPFCHPRKPSNSLTYTGNGLF